MSEKKRKPKKKKTRFSNPMKTDATESRSWDKKGQKSLAELHKVALATLDQIAGQPRNSLSRRLAKATLTFLETSGDPIFKELKTDATEKERI